MWRPLAFGYGIICYLIFLGVFLYLIGFLGNFGVPKSIDTGEPTATATALLVDGLLILLFGLQHTVMARPGFKRWFTRLIPPAVERNTYVLLTCVALGLIFWLWRPIDVPIWNVTSSPARELLLGIFAFGWVLVLVATFLINHFDLFGVRQAFLNLRGRPHPQPQFVTPGLYRLIRHPIYAGWMAAFWATPTMTLGHLLFAGGMTGYMLIAIPFEERDLVASLGPEYAEYRARTPRFLPRLTRRQSAGNRS